MLGVAGKNYEANFFAHENINLPICSDISPDKGADNFCTWYYGENYVPIEYKTGNYYESGKKKYQMKMGDDCAGKDTGNYISQTTCKKSTCPQSTPFCRQECKISDEGENLSGLYDIVCSCMYCCEFLP